MTESSKDIVGEYACLHVCTSRRHRTGSYLRSLLNGKGRRIAKLAEDTASLFAARYTKNFGSSENKRLYSRVDAEHTGHELVFILLNNYLPFRSL